MDIAVLLFDGFEVLDVFGPLEMFGMMPQEFAISMMAEEEGLVQSHQGPQVLAEQSIYSRTVKDVLLIPGGMGTRREVNNARLVEIIRDRANDAEHVLTVCTGAALLAKTELLDGLKATSNKMALEWVKQQGPHVKWDDAARWVADGKFFTSSGVSAGMDMTLGFIAKLYGEEASRQVALRAEYARHAK